MKVRGAHWIRGITGLELGCTSLRVFFAGLLAGRRAALVSVLKGSLHTTPKKAKKHKFTLE